MASRCRGRPLILGYVCEAGGLRGAVLCRAAAGKQPRTDAPAGPEAEMCPQSPCGAASRAGGVSALSSSVAYASQMTARRAQTQGAGGHRHGAQAGCAGGALAHCGAGQAPNRARRCALCPAVDWAPPTGGCRVSYSPHARWQMAAALATAASRWSAGGRTREATRAIYHQSASLHAQTDRGIVIYERNESRNKSEGVVEVCIAPKITFRMVSVY